MSKDESCCSTSVSCTDNSCCAVDKTYVSCCTSDCNSSDDNYGSDSIIIYDIKDKWVTNELHTPKGIVPVVSTTLCFNDRLGAWKVRWGIGRMNYKIHPGLYAIGKPDCTSPVLVSANYKLTFDSLRKELSGLNCWLMILDTKGVNVWCAAGKGTFGTKEIVNRIKKTGLSEIVSHRKIILPQLGAPGVSAHVVTKQTGFSVIYGTVRAKDIKAFIESNYKATEEMRTVKFTTWDRIVLTPVELMSALKKSIMIFGILFLVNLFVTRPFGLADFISYMGAVITGTVLTPLLLPLIPGKAFAWKGWLLGMLWTFGFIWYSGWFTVGSILLPVGYMLVLPSLSAYLAMNFTGSSTYTSFSGVIKEMKVAVLLIVITSILGIITLLVNSFLA